MTTITHQISTLSKPAKIILIEDNAEIIRWITDKINGIEKLELAGISNIFEGAFDLITREKPEVIILDLKLPDGNGIDILKEIRKARLNITVIVLSLNIHAKNLCLRMGADYFFDKSKDIGHLLEKLKEFNL